ncbi:hypothetical protein [Flavobacterium sp. 5]|uniref:hypothetical protein n=1 Tax=Flavobacterium sp. 5 TaxID=2035199 RepID=UPI000C2C090C|nr:hypothetical protein [Flavobacterium sp. 5]PKB16499.1 hypothetical protein CLU82_1637 [Flavobacterium sp. 5]
MKKTLLLLNGLFLISQILIAKEINTNALVSNTTVGNFESKEITFNNYNTSKSLLKEKNRVWLNFSNAGGAFKQSLVGYIAGATDGWDNLYDAVSADTNPYVDFYSINGGKNLTIQGRAVPFLTTDEVPLGYRTIVDGVFVISIDHVDGLLINQDIFLEDKTTGVFHNLKNGAYSFTTATGRFNDRFVLLYIDHTVITPPVIEEPVVSEVTDPIVIVPEVPIPVVTDPIVIIPEEPAPDPADPVVTDPIVTVPEEPTPIVTEPVVTDPIVTVPEEPAPIVTEPVVTDPIVIVPEEPTPIVTEPVVTDPIVIVPEEPTPIVTEPVVADPIVTIPEEPTPIVTEPVVTDPIVTVPEEPTPIITEPVVTDPIAIDSGTNVSSRGNSKGKSVIVAVSNNEITINSNEGAISEVLVYSLGEKQLFGRKNLNAVQLVIPNLGVVNQVLIIKTQLKNGKWAASKVVL